MFSSYISSYSCLVLTLGSWGYPFLNLSNPSDKHLPLKTRLWFRFCSRTLAVDHLQVVAKGISAAFHLMLAAPGLQLQSILKPKLLHCLHFVAPWHCKGFVRVSAVFVLIAYFSFPRPLEAGSFCIITGRSDFTHGFMDTISFSWISYRALWPCSHSAKETELFFHRYRETEVPYLGICETAQHGRSRFTTSSQPTILPHGALSLAFFFEDHLASQFCSAAWQSKGFVTGSACRLTGRVGTPLDLDGFDPDSLCTCTGFLIGSDLTTAESPRHRWMWQNTHFSILLLIKCRPDMTPLQSCVIYNYNWYVRWGYSLLHHLYHLLIVRSPGRLSLE